MVEVSSVNVPGCKKGRIEAIRGYGSEGASAVELDRAAKSINDSGTVERIPSAVDHDARRDRQCCYIFACCLAGLATSQCRGHGRAEGEGAFQLQPFSGAHQWVALKYSLEAAHFASVEMKIIELVAYGGSLVGSA